MIGADYSIAKALLLGAEYYFRDPNLPPHTFFDQHNVYASIRGSLNDLMSLSLGGLGACPAENLVQLAVLLQPPAERRCDPLCPAVPDRGARGRGAGLRSRRADGGQVLSGSAANG